MRYMAISYKMGCSTSKKYFQDVSFQSNENSTEFHTFVSLLFNPKVMYLFGSL